MSAPALAADARQSSMRPGALASHLASLSASDGSDCPGQRTLKVSSAAARSRPPRSATGSSWTLIAVRWSSGLQ